MDMTLWPSLLATRAQEVSDNVGCDPLVPLYAGLAAICGVVDARIRLELMEGFRVPPVLWLMTVGNPADKKSPGSRPMLTVISEIEAEDRPRLAKDMLNWEGKEAASASAKKAYLAFHSNPESVLTPDQAPLVPDLPPQPVPLKITVSDITSQKLIRHASDRPRGLLCYLDEMNGWVNKLVDKASGEDRSAWVVSYESEPYDMDRVGAGSIHCDNLAVSIYGNIQPRVFNQHVESLSSDGLIQRFIPAVLRSDYTRMGQPVPAYMTHKTQWDQAVRAAYALQPTTYKLSPDAYTAFRDFQAWYEGAKRDESLLQSCDTYMTAFGKMEGTVGRLMLLFHLIESPYSTHVSSDTVYRVVKLVKSYVIPALRYTLSGVAGTSFDGWLTDHLIHNCDNSTISLTDIKTAARKRLAGVPTWDVDNMILNAMIIFEESQWVKRVDNGLGLHRHQAQWVINPALQTQFAEHRRNVINARQRRRAEVYAQSTVGFTPIRGYSE